MKAKLFCIAFLLALPLAAQTGSTDLSSYQGPGIASPGVGDVGTASGQPVNLRFWAGVTGIYDTNVQPLITTAQGNLIHVPNLIGTAANFGSYGSHSWRHAQLALSYTGDYRYYPNNSTYNGTDQALTLGYTVQYSSHLVFDLRATGSTLSQTTGAVASTASAQGQAPGAPLFDTRTSFVNVAGDASFLQSARTSYTIGAAASDYIYQSGQLTDSSGYSATASVKHRLSPSNTLGAVYTYGHMESSVGSFAADTHSFAGQYFGALGPLWTVDVTAGATITQVHQLVAVQLSPLLASLFGVSSIVSPYDYRIINPSGRAEVKRRFQHAVAFGNFTQSTGGSNGVFLDTRNQLARAGISYTGVRKLNVGIDGNYQSAVNLGQGGGRTTWYGGGAGFTYQLVRYVNLVGRIDVGHYTYGGILNRPTTERATFGLTFSSKDIPLSLW